MSCWSAALCTGCVVELSHGDSPFGCWTVITKTTGQQLLFPASSHHLEQRWTGTCVLPGINCIQQGKLNPRSKRRLPVVLKNRPGANPHGVEFPRMELSSAHDGCHMADGTTAAWSAPSDPGSLLVHGTRMCSYLAKSTKILQQAHVHTRSTIWQPLKVFIKTKVFFRLYGVYFYFTHYLEPLKFF